MTTNGVQKIERGLEDWVIAQDNGSTLIGRMAGLGGLIEPARRLTPAYWLMAQLQQVGPRSAPRATGHSRT